MKKKLTLLLTLILSLVTLFSVSMIGASAETTNQGWKVEVADQGVVKGGNIDIKYTLKYNDDEVKAIAKQTDGADKIMYMAEPYVVILDGQTQLVEGAFIATEDMEVGEKTLTLQVFDQKGGTKLAEATFKFTIQKKDNTMTYVLVGFIVLIVGYMIYSSFANKKRQKKAQEQVSELKIGDKVMTIGGVHGIVKEICDKDNTFVLEVGNKSYVKFDKRAISEKHSASEAKAEEVKEEKTEVKEEKQDK